MLMPHAGMSGRSWRLVDCVGGDASVLLDCNGVAVPLVPTNLYFLRLGANGLAMVAMPRKAGGGPTPHR
jgi:hypothetical protein